MIETIEYPSVLAQKEKKTANVLVEPSFGYSDLNGNPKKPSLGEVFKEIGLCLKFKGNVGNLLLGLNLFFHFSNLLALLVLICYFSSIENLVFLSSVSLFYSYVYNTIWYHRYCSHNSFKFSHPIFPKLLLWTNPLVYREEIYAIAHHVHHQITEKPGDPYGPHLGWLGNYLGPELNGRINRGISQEQYSQLTRSISHIGLVLNRYEVFKRQGCVENPWVYIGRIIFSVSLWVGFSYFLGGFSFALASFAAPFVTLSMVRDFNWRGHGGTYRFKKIPGWEFDQRSRALNQHAYGLIASEWHDNHHNFPHSANSGFLPFQIDFAFQLIKALSYFGIVSTYTDASKQFFKEISPPPSD